MESYKKGYNNRYINELEDEDYLALVNAGFLNIEFDNYKLKDQIIINLYVSFPNYDSDKDEPQEKVYTVMFDALEDHYNGCYHVSISDKFYETFFTGSPASKKLQSCFIDVIFIKYSYLTFQQLVEYE